MVVCFLAQINHLELFKFKVSSDSNTVECTTRLVYRMARPDGRRTVPAVLARGGNAGFLLSLDCASKTVRPAFPGTVFGRILLSSVVASSSQELSLVLRRLAGAYRVSVYMLPPAAVSPGLGQALKASSRSHTSGSGQTPES